MAITTPSVTPRAYPVSANEARMGTAAGLRTRIDELRAQAEYLAPSNPTEAQALRDEADALAGVQK